MDVLSTLILIFFILSIVTDAMLFLPVIFNKSQNFEPNFEKPVSVVIAACNEYAHLKKLLTKLFKQNHPNFEVVVVNDRSTDESYDFLRELSYNENRLKVVNIKNTPEGMSSKKYALTLGFKAAKHDLLLLTDADCIPNSNNWISLMTAPYIQHQTTQVVLSYSGYKYGKGLLNLFIQYETLYTAIQYLGFALLGMPYMGVGRNLSYTKNLFFNVKGFQKIMHYISGDDDLFVQQVANKNNTAVVLQYEAFTTSEPKKNLKEYLVQKKRHLSAGKLYSIKYRVILAFVFLVHTFFWILAFIHLIINWSATCLILVGIKAFVRIFFMYKTVKLFKSNFLWYFAPIFEILYIFYYIVIIIMTLRSRKVSWK
jgi:glycosyltransferase involved in cell wall biosynthesis